MVKDLTARGRGAVVLVAVVVSLAFLPACQVNVHCPSVVPPAWWGGVDSMGISFPGFAGVDVVGTEFRPDDTASYPGARPVVVVDVGYGEDECTQWWSAWSLAGHGYVTLVFSAPIQPYQGANTEDAIDWLASSANAWQSQTDMSRLGLVGHSAGASAVETVQAEDGRVKGFVAYDGLAMMSFGCPDQPDAPSAQGAVVQTPRSPGLGVHGDTDCNQQLESGDPEMSTYGFEHWRGAGVPAAVLPLAGAHHLEFETDGPDLLHQHVFYATKSWLDQWVAGDANGLDPIIATEWNGIDRSTILSPYYRSAIDVPLYTCLDLRGACPAPGGGAGLTSPALVAPAAPLAAPRVGALQAARPLGLPGAHYSSDLDFWTGRKSTSP